MRMRKKKHGAERIAACSELLIENIEILKDGFDGIFPKSRPVHMEIGCGKGNFASGMAAKHQDVNFVAVEKVSDVCCIALEKAKARTEERPNDNLRFIIGDAKNLATPLTASTSISATHGQNRDTLNADSLTEDFWRSIKIC